MHLQDLVPRFKTQKVIVYWSPDRKAAYISPAESPSTDLEKMGCNFDFGIAKTFTWFGHMWFDTVELD